MDIGMDCLYTQKKSGKIPNEFLVWKAPEKKPTAKSDLFSVACIAFWLLCKREPTVPLSASNLQSDIEFLTTSGVSAECLDFMKKTLVYD